MDYPSTVWSQLKNITVESLMKALEKDGWEKHKPNGARHPYKKEGNKGKAERIVIHYHPKKTYGPKCSEVCLETSDGQLTILNV